MFKKQLLLLVIVISFCLNLSYQCPTSCICMWKDGKETVECVNMNLLIIPEGIDTGTQVLEFSGNNLMVLHKEKFLRMELVNIQKLYLSRCKLTTIDERAFKGLTNLVELELSGNLLDSVPTGTFLDAHSLMKLFLNNNPIKTLKKASFNHLTFLSTLEMNNCEISHIEDGAFIGLHSIGWLYIKNNKLTMINGTNTFPTSLKGIEMLGNPWECDCHMLDLHAWLQTFPMTPLIEPKCKTPSKFSNKSIKAIPREDLACLPDVSPTTFYLEIGEGKNVSLLCQVKAVPEAQVQWWFQGQLLQNDSIVAPGMRLIYFIEEGSIDKRSELFIYNSNAEDNGTFICTAENAAGTVSSNFTIRVVLREEPKFESIALHFEFLLITATAVGVSLVIILIIMILSIIRYHKTTKRIKKRESKHSTKDTLLQESVEDFSEQSKESSNVILVERQFYGANEDVVPIQIVPTQVRTPSSLRRLQLEQNPDLINDTGSTERRKDGEGQAHVSFAEVVDSFGQPATTANRSFRGSVRDLYRLSADVHLTPVGLLTTGDPRNYYKTLPYKRGAKRQSAPLINPYLREAEVVYDYTDVRYTADGYPVRTMEQETTFSEGSVHSCCSMPPVQWPSCVPATVVRMNSNPEPGKRCVGAQTQTENLQDVSVEQKVASLFEMADTKKDVEGDSKTDPC